MDHVALQAVTVTGNPTGRPILFVHGFGCDQSMWRQVAPAFEAEHQVILLDLIGCGSSNLSAYDYVRHASLQGHADDLVALAAHLGLRDAVLVGHSVSSMIAALAATQAPESFSAVAMISPSPCYINDDGYVGGFERSDIEALLASMDLNYLGWSEQMAPVIMANTDRPELAEELTNSFCRTDPEIASHFARVTFMGDNRADLANLAVPTLVVQVLEDAIAPVSVGVFVSNAVPNARLVELDTVGHCPHMSAPAETIDALTAFVAGLTPVAPAT